MLSLLLEKQNVQIGGSSHPTINLLLCMRKCTYICLVLCRQLHSSSVVKVINVISVVVAVAVVVVVVVVVAVVVEIDGQIVVGGGGGRIVRCALSTTQIWR